MNISNNYNHNQTPFQAYLRFKDTPDKIEKLRTVLSGNDKYLSVNFIEGKKKSTLEVLTGKHIDKFLDHVGETTNHLEFRTHLEEFFGRKPKKANTDKYIKKLDKNA